MTNDSKIKLIVFGAKGRVGRAVVTEARARGYDVTEAGHADADVTSPEDVARLAAGHDAAVVSVYDAQVAPDEFFPAAARAVAAGLTEAGVGRLVSVGLASVLADASGTLLMDTPDYPQEWRAFYLGHQAGTDTLRAVAPAGLDWVVLSPAGDFDHEPAGEPGDSGDSSEKGGYAAPVPADAVSRITHASFARAVVDQAGSPTLHAVHVGVGPAVEGSS